MSDSALPSLCWLDVPRPDAGLPPTEPIPPDVQASLERVADAIAEVKGPQLRSLVRYLAVDPGRLRFDNVARRLPERTLIDFLRRMTDGGGASSSAALPEPTLAALTRKALLTRILDHARLIALQRACSAVSSSTQTGQTV